MAQDSAQSPRIGQKVAVENAGIPLVTGANMPPAPWNGLLVYRTDVETFQVYSGNEGAWLDPRIGGGGSGGTGKTFVGTDEPAADNVGDLWIKTPENYLHYWDGTNWFLSVDPVAEAAAIAASDALTAANKSIYEIALANATEHATHVLTNPKTYFHYQTSMPQGKEGDLWYEPTSYTLRMLTNMTWENVTTLTPKLIAHGTLIAFYLSNTRPTDAFVGDLLLRGESKDRFGTEWETAIGDDALMIDEFVAVRTAYAQAIIDEVTETLGELTTWFRSADPASTQTVAQGDVWFKTDVNLVFRRDGAKWVQVTDPYLVESFNRAADARSIADSKIVSYRSADNDPPESPSEGDLWTVMDKGNLIRRWDGGNWVDLPSGTGAIVPGTIGRNELDTPVKEQIDAAMTSDGLPPSGAPGVEVVNGVSGTIFLKMTPPSNPDPITGYTIWMSKVSSFTGGPTTLYSSNAPSLVSLQGLDTDVDYYFYVAANDLDGTGPKSAQVTGKSVKIDSDQLAQDVLNSIFAAGEDAAFAQETADGKNSNTFSASASLPVVTDRVEGDIHTQLNGTTAIKQWVLESGAWVERKIDGAVLTNIDAATITTGFLNVAILIEAGAIQATQIASDSITTLQLAADSVTINELVVNEALAKSIVAEMMTSSVFRTSETGQRTQIDAQGIRTFDPSGTETSKLSADIGGLSLSGDLDLGSTGSVKASNLSSESVFNADGFTMSTDKRFESSAWAVVSPLGIVAGGDDRIYVVGIVDNVYQILVYVNGVLDDLWQPAALSPYSSLAFVSDSALYVTDYSSGTVTQFNPITHSQVRQWSVGTPYEIAYGPDNLLYVVDSGSSQLKVYEELGSLVRNWALPVSSFGVAVAPDGKVYVTAGDKIYIYSSTGTSIGQWVITAGALYGIAIQGAYVYVIDGSAGFLRILNLSDGAQVDYFTNGVSLGGVALDATGTIYTTNFFVGLVRVFLDGGVTASFDNAKGVLTASAVELNSVTGPFARRIDDILKKVATPVDYGDATNKNYVDNEIRKAKRRSELIGSPDSDWSNGGYRIYNVKNPIVDQDAATKYYVDNHGFTESSWTSTGMLSGYAAYSYDQTLDVKRSGSVVVMRGLVERTSGQFTDGTEVPVTIVPYAFRPARETKQYCATNSGDIQSENIMKTNGYLYVRPRGGNTNYIYTEMTWMIG